METRLASEYDTTRQKCRILSNLYIKDTFSAVSMVNTIILWRLRLSHENETKLRNILENQPQLRE